MATELQPAWSDAEGRDRAAALFRATYDGEPTGVWAAPGRVNLIGEHVDYNAGLCLPVALPHRTFAAVRRREDDRVRLVSAFAPGEIREVALDDVVPGGVDGWVAYAAGPAWALRQDGSALGGFDVALDSCLPVGAGLSSSAAVECAVATALSELFDLGLTDDAAGRARLAEACVRAENEVVGAPTGGMDQAVSVRSRQGSALLLDTRDHTVRQVGLGLDEAGLVVLVVDTRAAHALVDGQYAARRDACRRAAAELGVESLREVTDLDAALARLDDDELRRRVRHVVTEIARVGALVDLVEAGRVEETGPLLDASHASLRDDYEVSCAELDVAVEAARAGGALGARMTGGGFGGSALALVPADAVDAVAAAVASAFADRGWDAPGFLVAVPAPPAGRV